MTPLSLTGPVKPDCADGAAQVTELVLEAEVADAVPETLRGPILEAVDDRLVCGTEDAEMIIGPEEGVLWVTEDAGKLSGPEDEKLCTADGEAMVLGPEDEGAVCTVECK